VLRESILGQACTGKLVTSSDAPTPAQLALA
jgi:hypothetical protein